MSFQENNMVVYVEKKVLEDPALLSDDHFGPVKRKFCTFREGKLSLGGRVLPPTRGTSGTPASLCAQPLGCLTSPVSSRLR